MILSLVLLASSYTMHGLRQRSHEADPFAQERAWVHSEPGSVPMAYDCRADASSEALPDAWHVAMHVSDDAGRFGESTATLRREYRIRACE